jgi:IBR domain, a half RING-finger domain
MADSSSTELLNLEFIQQQLQNNIYRKCPKCKVVFDKDEACNFVSCGECKTQFCWICGLEKGSDSTSQCPFGHPTHNSH